jgi:quinol monooxygenase YgiN
MPKFALIASIEVAPGRRDEFLPLLRAHAARCLKDEPGTLQFDVLLPHDGGDKVMLYELYQDQAAFDAHSNGPSLAQLRKEAAGMMGKVSWTRCSLSA